MATRTVDVLVVGGGPAGLAVAERAARASLDVLVVERQREIAEHVRTSGMTARTTIERLAAPRATFHPIDRLRVIGPTRETEVDVSGRICVIDVRAFYRWLASRAIAAGAQIDLATTALDPLRDNAGAVTGCTTTTVHDERVAIRAAVVVDASGYRAHVSRRSGLHRGFARFGVGVELEVEAANANASTAVLIVGSRYAPTGYAWSFPCGASRLRIGVGLHHSDVRDDPAAFVRLLVQEQEQLRLGLRDARVLETHRGLIPADPPAKPIAGHGIVAVGDAAGQASLVAGEGIRLAIAAGELAGEVVADAVRRRDVSRTSLARYEAEFARRHRRSHERGLRFNARLARTRNDTRWDDRIDIVASMPAELLVGLLQAELPRRAVLRWASRHPREFGRLLRAALA